MRPCLRISILSCALVAAVAWDCPAEAAETDTSHGVAPRSGEGVAVGPNKSRLGRIWQWSDAQLRGIFDVVLPDTQERGTLKLSFQPRVWDLVDDDYVRVPMGVTYGFNRRTEGEFEVDGYFNNPWQDASGIGISNLRGSLKRRWKPSEGSLINAASGFEVTRPIRNSPAELNHGINRYSTFMTFSRKIGAKQSFEGIFNVSYDLITPSAATGWIPKSHPQDDFFRISPGVLHHRGRITYGLSTSWSHTVDGPAEDYFSITPSVIFEIPPKYVFNSPGRWQLGLAVEGKHYAEEYDVNVRLRMRWLGSISRVYKDWREQRRANGVSTRADQANR